MMKIHLQMKKIIMNIVKIGKNMALKLYIMSQVMKKIIINNHQKKLLSLENLLRVGVLMYYIFMNLKENKKKLKNIEISYLN